MSAISGKKKKAREKAMRTPEKEIPGRGNRDLRDRGGQCLITSFEIFV